MKSTSNETKLRHSPYRWWVAFLAALALLLASVAAAAVLGWF
jgi:hypothetical protein